MKYLRLYYDQNRIYEYINTEKISKSQIFYSRFIVIGYF